MRILAIIPARGGSKGIPRKNLTDVGGKPLIAWSIETAQQLAAQDVIASFIVSTDDEEIAAVSRAQGAPVPFLRPEHLASDTAKAIGYVLHAISYFGEQGEAFDAILLLQPTAPIRDTQAIVEAVGRFAASEADSLISCYREDYINDLVMYLGSTEGALRPKHPDHNKGVRRQDHGAVWVRNGAVYLTRTSYILEHERLVSDAPLLLPMSKVDSVNLDVPEDLLLLRALICARAS